MNPRRPDRACPVRPIEHPIHGRSEPTMKQVSHGISFQDVGRTFMTREGKTLTALQTVRFEIEPGEFVSLLGPSGCGKTTLLRMVAGLLSPSWGKVMVGGSEVTRPRPDFGVIFQQ